ncbi:MAG: flagellar basal body-associated FliL family protein [Gemmatimonadaceae bacterium]|jgi:flagellar FliL protein|nr:flagellar basal body-associated FliL family protein [Gemmatimonadaceae bacterium]
MADTEAPDLAADGETKKKGLPPFALPAVGLLLGLGGGGFVGAKVVAPKLTHGLLAVNAAHAALDTVGTGKDAHGKDGDAHVEEGDEDGEHAEGEKGPPAIYTVADMVLNPAGSGGTRFVMLSVAMQAKDSATVATLTAHDAEIRDALLALVGNKTVEQLAEVSAREPLKTEIMATVAAITKQKQAVKRVSFPQFVIQ